MSLVLIQSQNADVNASAEVQVGTWTSPNRTGLRALLSLEVRAGDGVKPIAGGGLYTVRVLVASQEVARQETFVAVGVTRKTFVIEGVPVGPNEAVVVYLTGLPADVDVDVTANYLEATEDQAIGRAELGVSRAWFVDGTYGNAANSGGSRLAAKATFAGVIAAGLADGDGIWLIGGHLNEAVSLYSYPNLVLRGDRGASLGFDGSPARTSTLVIGSGTRVGPLRLVSTCSRRTDQGQAHVAALSVAGGNRDVTLADLRVESLEGGIVFDGGNRMNIVGCRIDASEYGIGFVNSVADGDGTPGSVSIQDVRVRLRDWTLCSTFGISLMGDAGDAYLSRSTADIRNVVVQVEQPAGAAAANDAVAIEMQDMTASVEGATLDVATQHATNGAYGIRATGSAPEVPSRISLGRSSIRTKSYVGGTAKEIAISAGMGAFVEYSGLAVSGALTGDVSAAPPGEAILADTNALQTDGVQLSTQGKSDVTGAVPTAAAIGTDAASKVLATPAQKLATDETGRVTVGTSADKTGYALATAPPTKEEIAAQVAGEGGRTLADLATPDDVKPTVLPVDLTVQPPYVTIAGPSSRPFDLPQGYAADLALVLTDSGGDPLDLSGAGEIRFRVATRAGVDVFTLTTEDDSVEVTDAEEGQVTLHFTATHLATVGTYRYAFGSMAGPTPYGEGPFLVREMMGLGS